MNPSWKCLTILTKIPGEILIGIPEGIYVEICESIYRNHWSDSRSNHIKITGGIPWGFSEGIPVGIFGGSPRGFLQRFQSEFLLESLQERLPQLLQIFLLGTFQDSVLGFLQEIIFKFLQACWDSSKILSNEPSRDFFLWISLWIYPETLPQILAAIPPGSIRKTDPRTSFEILEILLVINSLVIAQAISPWIHPRNPLGTFTETPAGIPLKMYSGFFFQ